MTDNDNITRYTDATIAAILARCPADGLLPDAALTPAERAALARYLTPRTGSGGRRLWPIDELMTDLRP